MTETNSRTQIRLVAPNTAHSTDSHASVQARIAIDSVLEYEVDDTSEFIFLIHASDMPGQTLIKESLMVEPHIAYRCYTDADSGNRFLRLQAPAGKLKVVKVNIDENRALQARFDAMSIPTMVVLRDGKETARQIGALPQRELQRWVEQHT